MTDDNAFEIDEGKADTSKEESLNIKGKTMQKFMILMMIAYPNIIYFLLMEFKCVDIESESRLKADIEIICWKGTHNLIAYAIALPALIVWGIGLPLGSFWVLT
jgi:hypothetical protein